MFIVTNRGVDETKSSVKEAFSSRLNPLGSNELRLAEAVRKDGEWQIRILPDMISDTMAAEVGIEREIDPTTGTAKPIYASSYVARRILARVNPKMVGESGNGRNLVFFVHGFNNDVKAVLDRAELLEKTYGVEVLPFTWPANGGGLHGVASYKSDKRDALASGGALDRCLSRMHELLDGIHEAHVKRVEDLADKRFGGGGDGDAEQWDRFFSEHAHKWCPFTINLLLHSMGNYLFKHLLKSSVYHGGQLLFDNVILASADTNNEGHAEWVDRISCRGRIYITINERDSALKASRMKLGEKQKIRLGHCPYNLDSQKAIYVDFTSASHVKKSHAYFEGSALKNEGVKRFFEEALNGEAAESALRFDVARRMYRIR